MRMDKVPLFILYAHVRIDGSHGVHRVCPTHVFSLILLHLQAYGKPLDMSFERRVASKLTKPGNETKSKLLRY